MSKAQSRQIVYIIMAVFALVILLFGYEAVQKITAFNREREIKNFGITLENNLKRYSTAPYSYGSVNEKAFSLPGGVESICFVDRSKEINRFADNELNVQVNNFPDENIFLKPFGEFIPINVKYLELSEGNNPLCVKAVNSKISLALTTKGSAAEITALNESKEVDCVSIIYNGKEESKIDIVFLGYAYEKADDFSNDVNGYINIFLETEPFKRSSNRINFYRIDKFPDLKCDIKDWIQCDDFAVKKLASECPNDYIFVLVDRSRIAEMIRPVRSAAIGNTAKINAAERKTVLVHEFGHSFGGLADEYVDEDYYGATEFNAKTYPNCDTAPCSKWSLMTKGCYGGCSLGVYNRPTENSIMRSLRADYFGVVNEHAIEGMLDYYK